MAKKSFKKGVKSIIESKTNAKEESTVKKTSEKKNQPQSRTIKIGDTCTVQNVEVFYKNLLEIPISVKKIIIKGDNVLDIDLSYVQVLQAFKKHTERKGIEVSIQLNLSANAKQLLAIAGIEEGL